MISRPSELPDPGADPISCDTETCTLAVDDVETITGVQSGAVAVVSVAFKRDGQIETAAFPFAQGKIGKEREADQMSLFSTDGDDPNLDWKDWDTLLAWLQASRIVFHNAKFDLQHLTAGTMARPATGQAGWRGVDLADRTIWDTMLACREIWPTEATSLKPTAARLWGEDETAEQRALKAYLGPKDNPRFDLVPWDVIRPYAAKDAELTLRLFWEQLVLIDEGYTDRRWLYREFDQSDRLRRIEDRGLPYDVKGSLTTASTCAERQSLITKELAFRPTINEAKRYFFTNQTIKHGPHRTPGLDLIPYAVTEKGAPQLTEQDTERLIRDHAAKPAAMQANHWRDWNKLAKARSMWYEGYANKTGADGRLRTCFRMGKVVSGRYSVERVNVQAIPQSYRLEGNALRGLQTPRDLIASAVAKLPGWRLWELDLAQAELRIAALFAGCETMLTLLRNGDDLHGYTTTQLFDLTKDSADWGKYRQVGKRANFSLVFDAGWETFAAMVAKETGIRMPQDEAEPVVNGWRRLYPEFPRAVKKWHSFVERHQHVPLVNGKLRWYFPYEDWHTAFNQLVQGSLAEYAKDWTCLTDDICRSYGLDDYFKDGVRGGLVNLVHDSQMLLLPDDCADAVIEDIRQAGLALWDEFFPEIPGGIDVKEFNK